MPVATYGSAPQIDINSRALLDMISDETVEVQPLAARAESAANHKITIDEAFDDW
jgi:hypothetical protein